MPIAIGIEDQSIVQMEYILVPMNANGITIPIRIAVDVENKVNITNKFESLHKKYVSVVFGKSIYYNKNTYWQNFIFQIRVYALASRTVIVKVQYVSRIRIM